MRAAEKPSRHPSPIWLPKSISASVGRAQGLEHLGDGCVVTIAAACQGLCCDSVEAAIPEIGVVDVHADDLADDHPAFERIAVYIMEAHRMHHTAFERSRRGGDA